MVSASWYKLGGLAALQGAISLTWLIYNIYLPKLLISFGFAPELAVSLVVVENALGAILEPLLGGLSDRAYRWIATKFGFVALGVILASAVFVLIPTVVVFRNALTAITWILPGVLIAWAMAMTIFRSPALSLIGRYAFASELPIAVSFLTLTGGVIGAIRPVSQNFILSLGAPFAFTIGSIVLLAAAGLLRYVDPPTPNNLAVAESKSIPLVNYALVLGAGFGIAWGTRCLIPGISNALKVHLPQIDNGIATTLMLIAIAICAVPGGRFAAKIGNRRAMLWGLWTTLVALLILGFIPIAIAIAVALLAIILCFNLVTNGAIPFALELFSLDRAGLAVGLYFGGFSAGMSSFSAIFNPPTILTPLFGAIVGANSLLLAATCVWWSLRTTTNN
jgi:hypothetical protein